jgi:hypothetical protein
VIIQKYPFAKLSRPLLNVFKPLGLRGSGRKQDRSDKARNENVLICVGYLEQRETEWGN